MIDYESKTNEELNELAALRCGWIFPPKKQFFNGNMLGWPPGETFTQSNLMPCPDYTLAFNLGLCVRDYVPVLMELNRQIDMSFYFDDGTGLHKWIWTCDIADGDYSAYDTNPARAFTIAFLESTERG